jgi:hypothetical protein
VECKPAKVVRLENCHQLLYWLTLQSLNSKVLIEHPSCHAYIRLTVLSPKCVIGFGDNYEQKFNTNTSIAFHPACAVAFQVISLTENENEVQRCRKSFEFDMVQLSETLFEQTVQQLVSTAKFCLVNALDTALHFASDDKKFDDAELYSYVVDFNK